jgi:hypothetical protein
MARDDIASYPYAMLPMQLTASLKYFLYRVQGSDNKLQCH